MNGWSCCLGFEEDPIGDAISRIRFAPLSNNLLFSSWDSNLRLYDIDSSKLRAQLQTQAALLDCCFLNETVALTAASDFSVTRYDFNSGINTTIGYHNDVATCVDYSDETCQIITSGWDKKIRSWDARSTKALETLNLAEEITCVRPNFNSEGFIVGSINGRVAVKYFSPSSSKFNGYIFRCHPKVKDGRAYPAAVNDIAFNTSGCGGFATGDNEGYVIIWDARSKKRVLEMPRYPNGVASLSYNHDGCFLAVASSHTYQEANEVEKAPQIFIHEVDEQYKKILGMRKFRIGD